MWSSLNIRTIRSSATSLEVVCVFFFSGHSHIFQPHLTHSFSRNLTERSLTILSTNI